MAAATDTILFDGVCNLCNGSVVFVLQRDSKARFRFAALQSEAGEAVLRKAREQDKEGAFGKLQPALDSIVLVTAAGQVYTHSSAALRIALHLDGIWPLLSVFWLVPQPIRDFVYRWVARNRYKWFGKSDACALPLPEWKGRFLE